MPAEHAAYIMQTALDRLKGLAADIDRESAMLWDAGHTSEAEQLGRALVGIAIAEFALSGPRQCFCAGHLHGQARRCSCCAVAGPVRSAR